MFGIDEKPTSLLNWRKMREIEPRAPDTNMNQNFGGRSPMRSLRAKRGGKILFAWPVLESDDGRVTSSGKVGRGSTSLSRRGAVIRGAVNVWDLMQNDIQQRTMDFHMAVVADQAKPAKLVHEVVDA